MRVWFTDDAVNVQDLRDPRAEPLVFSHSEWSTFVDAVRRGEFRFPEPLQNNDSRSLDDDEP